MRGDVWKFREEPGVLSGVVILYTFHTIIIRATAFSALMMNYVPHRK